MAKKSGKQIQSGTTRKGDLGSGQRSINAATMSHGKANSKSKSSEPRRMGEFSVVKIGQHTSYVKKHDGEDERTIFLVNVPIDATEENIRSMYEANDGVAIEEVKLWKGKGVANEEEERESDEIETMESGAPSLFPLPSIDPRQASPFLPTSTNAHITFSSQSGLQQALSLSTLPAWKESASLPCGLTYLLQRTQSLRPPLESIRTHADSVIARFEWRLKHPQKKKSRIEAVSYGPNGELLDADGFTIVQSTGKYGRTTDAAGGASVRVARARSQNSASAGRRRRGIDDLEGEADGGRDKKKKKIELEDFYRFQRREAKREELADLRAKFQADQEKIKKLKATRTFRPY